MNGPCSISWKLFFIIGYEIINLISPISTHLTFKLANQINCESSLWTLRIKITEINGSTAT